MNTTGVYLDSYLAPLAPILARPDVTDVYVNRPAEIWIETLGGAVERHDMPSLTEATLARLARQVAASSAQGISREHPLLSATLPDGSRVQIIAPPATRGPLALAVRKHVAAGLVLSDYITGGAFDETELRDSATKARPLPFLSDRPDGEVLGQFIGQLVRDRLNVLISGGTSSGKTTFLNALLREIPAGERLILIEDTPELTLGHANAIGLLAARSALSEAAVNSEDLLNAALRMRPDRIILGEIRGSEAFSFLRAVNTGHPGSLTTIHADSPRRAIEQLALLVLQTGTRLGWDDVIRYVSRSIDVFIQLDRKGGRRRIAEIMLSRDFAREDR